MRACRWLTADNAFEVIAGDLHGDSMTNQYAANLPVNTRLTFDLNGNTISDGMRRFDYDDFNELICVTATNSWKTEYDYDGLMRRHERRDFVWLNSVWQLRNTCYYVYAGGKVVEESGHDHQCSGGLCLWRGVAGAGTEQTQWPFTGWTGMGM